MTKKPNTTTDAPGLWQALPTFALCKTATSKPLSEQASHALRGVTPIDGQRDLILVQKLVHLQTGKVKWRPVHLFNLTLEELNK